jgi:hypothetical protein
MTAAPASDGIKAFIKERLGAERSHNVREWKYRALAPYEHLTGHRRERRRFLDIHGYPLNLHAPRSFNEKLCWRKLYDRNPLFPVVVDKFLVRSYVEMLLGKAEADTYLTPLVFEVKDPMRIPFADLPEQYVVKANHGSAMNIVVRSKDQFGSQYIIDKCCEWLRTTHGLYGHEWAYSRVDRRIMGEKLINGHGSLPPREIKLHVFDGRVRLIQLHECDAWYDGHTLDTDDYVTITFYTPSWEKLELLEDMPSAEPEPPPVSLEEIVELAERLGKPFDYMRVDLYLAREGIRVGELSPYPGGGFMRISPTAVTY